MYIKFVCVPVDILYFLTFFGVALFFYSSYIWCHHDHAQTLWLLPHKGDKVSLYTPIILWL